MRGWASRRAGLGAVLTAVALATGGDDAGASTVVRFTQSSFSYRADPGEINDVTATFEPDGVVFEDPGADAIGYSADWGWSGAPCTADGAHRMFCPYPSFDGDGGSSFQLGDGDDRA